jgi:hypothetical protein
MGRDKWKQQALRRVIHSLGGLDDNDVIPSGEGIPTHHSEGSEPELEEVSATDESSSEDPESSSDESCSQNLDPEAEDDPQIINSADPVTVEVADVESFSVTGDDDLGLDELRQRWQGPDDSRRSRRVTNTEEMSTASDPRDSSESPRAHEEWSSSADTIDREV